MPINENILLSILHTNRYKQGTYTGPGSVASTSPTIKKKEELTNSQQSKEGIKTTLHTNILRNLTYFCNFPAQGGFILLKLLPVRHQQLKDITGYLSYQLVGKLEEKR